MFLIACGLTLVCSVAMPLLVVVIPVMIALGMPSDKLTLILVAMVDFFQTVVLMPLAYVGVWWWGGGFDHRQPRPTAAT